MHVLMHSPTRHMWLLHTLVSSHLLVLDLRMVDRGQRLHIATGRLVHLIMRKGGKRQWGLRWERAL